MSPPQSKCYKAFEKLGNLRFKCRNCGELVNITSARSESALLHSHLKKNACRAKGDHQRFTDPEEYRRKNGIVSEPGKEAIVAGLSQMKKILDSQNSEPVDTSNEELQNKEETGGLPGLRTLQPSLEEGPLNSATESLAASPSPMIWFSPEKATENPFESPVMLQNKEETGGLPGLRTLQPSLEEGPLILAASPSPMIWFSPEKATENPFESPVMPNSFQRMEAGLNEVTLDLQGMIETIRKLQL